jgi:hypothetical protein
MKTLTLIILLIPSLLLAQDGIPGSFIDLNDTQFVQDKLYAADIERAQRENYYDAIDGRFGGQKPLTYYVDLRAAQAVRDQILREQQPFNQMLNDALQKEDEIRAKLLDLQSHYSFAQKTINAQFIHLWHLESVIERCKQSRGRSCKY